MADYYSQYTGVQADKTIKSVYAPTFFSVKSTSSNAMVQAGLIANTWQDVVFANVEPEFGGDFSYDGDVLTYTGDDNILLELNISASLDSSVTNTIVSLGQWKNGIIDYGAMNQAKLESATAIIPIPITSTFELSKNDTLNLRIMADKDCSVSVYSIQILLKQFKVKQ